MGTERLRAAAGIHRMGVVTAVLALAAMLVGCHEERPMGLSVFNDTPAPVEVWYAIDGAETRQTSVKGRVTIEAGATEEFELDMRANACTKHPISVRAGSDVVAVIPPCQYPGRITTVSFWPPDSPRPDESPAP